MPILTDDLLSSLGLLTVKQTIKQAFTDKPNTNLVVSRLLNQEKAFYSTKVQVDISQYKTIVLSDWSFAENNNQSVSCDIALWQEWIELDRTLFVYFDNQLIKIESKNQLNQYLAHMQEVNSYQEIQQALAENSIAHDQVVIVDHFKRQQIQGAIDYHQNGKPQPPSALNQWSTLEITTLLKQEKTDIKKIISSFESNKGNIDFTLEKTGFEQSDLTTLTKQLLDADFFTGIIIDAEALSSINQYLKQNPKTLKIKHISMSGIDIYSQEAIQLLTACPELSSLSYKIPQNANNTPQHIPETLLKHLQNLKTLYLYIFDRHADIEHIRGFEHSNALETLCFYSLNVNDYLFPQFLKVSKLINLQLRGVNLDEDAINHFNCPKLSYIGACQGK